MQTATILLNLGGNAGNQVPKHNVTPSEVAVLRLLHGDDAVNDIAITGEVKRNSRTERERLHEIYAKAMPDGGRRCPALDALFPGVAARLYQDFEEMGLDEFFFKTGHAPARPETDEEDEENEEVEGNGGNQGAADDGIEDLNDEHTDDVGDTGDTEETDENDGSGEPTAEDLFK